MALTAGSTVRGITQFGQVEWDTRVELAACYRIFDYLGWTELIYNHITLRVPGPEKHFLINPFGLHYSEVTASNLVKIDLDGNPIGDSDYPVNLAGYVIHSAVHRHREDAHCIMHTHTTAGMAVACLEEGLTYDNFMAAFLTNVAYHDFQGVTVDRAEQDDLVNSLGQSNALILRNHGLLSCGPTVAKAFSTLWTLERACQIQLATHSMNKAVLPLPEKAFQRTADLSNIDKKRTYNPEQMVLDWLRREIDKRDPSYAT